MSASRRCGCPDCSPSGYGCANTLTVDELAEALWDYRESVDPSGPLTGYTESDHGYLHLMSNSVTLFCQAGQHEWERPAQRGRKPLNCPDHQPVAAPAVAAGVETLTCQHDGHTWERSRTRGRKPPYCPEHKPQQQASAPTTRLSPEHKARMREGRERAIAERSEAGFARVQAFSEWSKRDAAHFLSFQQGIITREEYKARAGEMPPLPSRADYQAAGRLIIEDVNA